MMIKTQDIPFCSLQIKGDGQCFHNHLNEGVLIDGKASSSKLDVFFTKELKRIYIQREIYTCKLCKCMTFPLSLEPGFPGNIQLLKSLFQGKYLFLCKLSTLTGNHWWKFPWWMTTHMQ